MKIKFQHIAFLLISMLGLHIIANFLGMYETKIIWIDKVLHVMAGIAIGMFWLLISLKHQATSRLINFMSIIGFVLLIALIWEIAEFAFWNLLPNYAEKLELYSPHIKDVLTDMTANLLGAILLGYITLKK